MDTIKDIDTWLCNLAYQEYIYRKQIMELNLKINNNLNAQKLQAINEQIDLLRTNANHLFEIRVNALYNNSQLKQK